MENTDLPDIIYHYCSPEAFFSIISNKNIWLSSCLQMNDHTEGKWFLSIFDTALKQLELNQDNSQQIQILKDYFNKYFRVPYIASFSENADLLSQWRGYAQDGQGVAIGFNTKSLGLDRTASYSETKPNFFLELGKVKYIEKDSAKKIENLKGLIKVYAENEASGKKESQLKQFASWIYLQSLIHKNDAFKEEDEWRIVHVPTILENKLNNTLEFKDSIGNLEHRVGGGKITSYFEFPYHRVEEIKPIAEIILGPRNKFNDFELNSFLKQKNCGHISPKKSAATYQ
ncbi:MAG: DUF2971 domain-containing protein [SAR324 cluster bacterium]|nr:DUF2971 domain-containing protein [SAR324 cluster bacterium]